ncbi:YkvI family membrane protein [Aneurinibacillus sp. REN35]|uniref:YkvI family membrane protein n=1 Tax=Aneurinibacillus sp. REN35 TaxID=3237286 RepID=UPI0035285610
MATNAAAQPTRWFAALQVGFTYIGTIVGAGFASGQEIFHFVTRYGNKSIIIILVSVLLFTLAGAQIMLLASRIQASSYHQFNEYVFGKKAGVWVNGFTLLTLLCTTGVMLAGSGALFTQQWGGFYQVGILGTALLVYLITSRGMHAIMSINMLVVPIMLGFTILIGMYTFAENGMNLPVSPTPSPAGWTLSPFLYVAFNLSLALAVLVPLGNEVQDRRTLINGSMIGGAGLGILLLLSNYALLTYKNDIAQAEVPMAMVVASLGPFIQWMFSLVILGEIFTTLVGNVFGLTRQLQLFAPFASHPRLLIVGLLMICYLISQFGFSTLVHHLYPIFGYLGAGTMLMIFLARYKTV